MSKKSAPKSLDPSITAALLGVFGVIAVTLISVFRPLFVSSQIGPFPTSYPISSFEAPTHIYPYPTTLPVIIPADIMSLDEQVENLHKDLIFLQDRLNEVDKINQRVNVIEIELKELEKSIYGVSDNEIDYAGLSDDLIGLRNEVLLLRSEVSGSTDQSLFSSILIIPIGRT